MDNTQLFILALSLQFEVDRRALVARCLALEAQVSRLKGIPEPLPPTLRRIQRRMTPQDIATMRELRARKLSPVQIARRLRISDTTVRVHMREVGS